MFDYVVWEETIADAEDGYIESPPICGRLLRLKVTVSGPEFNEGGIQLYSSGKQLTPLCDGFTGCDVFLRLPVQSAPYDIYHDVESSAGYKVFEAPVLWGPLRAWVNAGIYGATWKFEAIIER